MPIRNHIAKKDTSWCGDAPIKFKSIEEAMSNIECETNDSYDPENDPCAKCLTIIANNCLDELGLEGIQDD